MGAASSEDRASTSMAGTGGGIFRSPLREFLLIFFLSLAVRAVLLAAWANNHEDFYRLGGEIGKVALSLVRSGQFADPYKIPTGPTAHPLPFCPALLALIYHVFGITATAGYVRALVGISSHSTLYALLPWFGRRLGLGRRAGIFAGVAGALLPLGGLGEATGSTSLAKRAHDGPEGRRVGSDGERHAKLKTSSLRP